MIPCLAAGSCLCAQPRWSWEEDPGWAVSPGCGFFSQSNSCDLLAPLPGARRSRSAHGCSWAVSCFWAGRIQLPLAAQWESEIRRESPAPPAPSALGRALCYCCILHFPLSCSSRPLDWTRPGGGTCKCFNFDLFLYFPQ